MTAIRWRHEPTRIVAMCGDVAVGAVYPALGRRCRWRAWVTKNINTTESNSASVGLAQLAVEKRFEEFLVLAQLQPTPK